MSEPQLPELIPELWDIITEYLWVESTVFRILEARQINPDEIEFYTSGDFGKWYGIAFDWESSTVRIGSWSFAEIVPYLRAAGLNAERDYNIDALKQKLGNFCIFCIEEIGPEDDRFYSSLMPIELMINPNRSLLCGECVTSRFENFQHEGKLHINKKVLGYELHTKTFVALLTIPNFIYIFYLDGGKIKMLEIQTWTYIGIPGFVSKRTMRYPEFIATVAEMVFGKK